MGFLSNKPAGKKGQKKAKSLISSLFSGINVFESARLEFSMRSRLLFISALFFAATGWWIWQNNPNVRTAVEQYIDNGEILTLEARYTAEKIMEQHAVELLGDGEHSFHRADLKFHPYVLFDVKYSSFDKKTKEGGALWDLVDGEMVIDCESWEKTHGFEDAICAKANRNDFKILNALAKNKGKLTLDQLTKELHVEDDLLYSWLEAAKDKHLIVQKGNEIQLHFQNPKILVPPQTKITQSMVKKPYNHAQKIASRYSVGQIEKNAYAAFGQDFTIRTQRELFLPVYSIEVLNPDGSILTTYWNALSGQRIIPRYLSYTE